MLQVYLLRLYCFGKFIWHILADKLLHLQTSPQELPEMSDSVATERLFGAMQLKCANGQQLIALLKLLILRYSCTGGTP